MTSFRAPFPVVRLLRGFLVLLVVRDFVNRFHAWRSSFDAGNAAAGLAAGVLGIHSLLAAVVREEVQSHV